MKKPVLTLLFFVLANSAFAAGPFRVLNCTLTDMAGKPIESSSYKNIKVEMYALNPFGDGVPLEVVAEPGKPDPLTNFHQTYLRMLVTGDDQAYADLLGSTVSGFSYVDGSNSQLNFTHYDANKEFFVFVEKVALLSEEQVVTIFIPDHQIKGICK